MWFSDLNQEEQKQLVKAFTDDGFRVQHHPATLVAEKNGQKVVISRLDSAKLFLNLKLYLHRQQLLAKSVGGIEFTQLLNFLQREKGETESYLDCLKRIAIKFNWEAVRVGEVESHELNPELVGVFSHTNLEYVEIETDHGDKVTILAVDSEYGTRIYAANGSLLRVERDLERFDKQAALRDLAPNAYLTLQAFSL